RRPGRVLPADLPDRWPAQAACRRHAPAGAPGRRSRGRAADQLRRRQDALDARALSHGRAPRAHLARGPRPADGRGGRLCAAEDPAAVLVGTALSPGEPTEHEDGVITHTLWGELAWQLGGREGYAMLAESDRARVSP